VFGFGQVSAKPNKPRKEPGALLLITVVESGRRRPENIGMTVAKAMSYQDLLPDLMRFLKTTL